MKVYISAAKESQQFALNLVRSLIDLEDVDYQYSPYGNQPGYDNWMKNAISHADIVLIFIDEHYSRSRSAKTETTIALDSSISSKKGPVIIPIVLGENPTPEALKDTKCLKCPSDSSEDIQRLANQLTTILVKTRKSSHLPAQKQSNISSIFSRGYLFAVLAGLSCSFAGRILLVNATLR